MGNPDKSWAEQAAAFLIARDEAVRRLGVEELAPAISQSNQPEFIEQYIAAEQECEQLRAENARLREALSKPKGGKVSVIPKEEWGEPIDEDERGRHGDSL